MVHPEDYYKSALHGAINLEGQLTKEQIKAERKSHRDKVGCSGCYHAEEVITGTYLCQKGEKPHDGGWCKWWHDLRTGKEPT